MAQANVYDTLAALFRYPGEGYAQHARSCARTLAAEDAEAAALVERFAQSITGLSVERLQEEFIHTFDLKPTCALEIGWHLFGENYERGAMLVKLRGEMRRYALPETEELPDHLTSVLALLGRMEPERAEDFACACVLPALARMLPAFEGNNNPWEKALQAVWQLLHGRYPHAAFSSGEQAPALRVLS